MSVSVSTSVLSRWAAFQQLSAALTEGALCLEADALWGSSRALVQAAIMQDGSRPILSLVASAADRSRAARDLAFFAATVSPARGGRPDGRVLEFPSEQPAAWRGVRHREHDAERALCCHRLLAGEPVAIVTTPAALSLRLL